MSISKDKCGIRVGNLKKVPSRFICPKCKLVLRSPVQGECGHRYCSDAIPAEGLDCIACKEEGEEDVPHLTTMLPDQAITRELNRTKFQCPWDPCKETLPLTELIEHAESNCQHREVRCELCDSQLPASALQEHVANKCPKRRVECNLCKQLVPNDQLERHKNEECIGSTQPCLYCLTRIRDSDDARLQHLKDCPVGWANGQPCPFGCGKIDDVEAHRAEYAALHADRLLAQMSSIWQSPALETGDAGAVALEPTTANPRSAQYEMQLVEDTLDEADLVLNLGQFGSPEHPRQTSDPRGQAAFFDRIKYAPTAPVELAKQKDDMDRKLQVTYQAMNPLMTEMQRQFDELNAADSIYKELLCAMSLKEVRICDLDRSIMLQELGSTDGTLVWKIAFFKERIISTEYEPVLFSPLLFTDKFGYKLSAVAYLNGNNSGRGTHISVYARINKGPYDAALQWPFKQKVTFTLLNQSSPTPSDHLVRHFVPDSSSRFQRPSQPTGQLFGFDQFAVKDDLEAKGFLKDDTIFIKIQVAKPPLF